MAAVTLPADKQDQVYVELWRLPNPCFQLPSSMFVKDDDPKFAPFRPSMSWLIQHPTTKENILFDLGLPADGKGTPAVRAMHSKIPKESQRDAFSSLEKAGIDAEKDVNLVIFSHLHWDHNGDPSKLGPNTKFLIGNGAKELLTGPRSYPTDPESSFDSNLLPLERVTECPPTSDAAYWKPLGPFPAAHDLYNDGSIYIIDTPGHLPGHISALVRTEPNKFVMLAGDVSHDHRITKGEREIGHFDDGKGGTRCSHEDKETAIATIEKVRQMHNNPNVEVIIAHDYHWLQQNPSKYVKKL